MDADILLTKLEAVKENLTEDQSRKYESFKSKTINIKGKMLFAQAAWAGFSFGLPFIAMSKHRTFLKIKSREMLPLLGLTTGGTFFLFMTQKRLEQRELGKFLVEADFDENMIEMIQKETSLVKKVKEVAIGKIY